MSNMGSIQTTPQPSTPLTPRKSTDYQNQSISPMKSNTNTQSNNNQNLYYNDISYYQN